MLNTDVNKITAEDIREVDENTEFFNASPGVVLGCNRCGGYILTIAELDDPDFGAAISIAAEHLNECQG